MNDSFLKCGKCNTENSPNSKYCRECGSEISTSVTNKNNKKKYVPILSGVLAFIVAYIVIQLIFFKPTSLDGILMQTAKEMNSICPMMVDRETRLDNTTVLPDKTLQYNYTLVNLEKENIDTTEARKNLEPNIVNNVKTHPDMKSFRNNRITLSYCYRDKNGYHVMTIRVTPEQYK